MFSKESLLYGVGAGSIAIALYLLASGQHSADSQVLKAEHTLESARFDKDFARVSGQAVSAETTKEIAEAQVALANARATASTNLKQKNAQEGELLKGVSADIKVQSGGAIDLEQAKLMLK